MDLIKQIEDLVSNDRYKYKVLGILMQGQGSDKVFFNVNGAVNWSYYPDIDQGLDAEFYHQANIKKLFNLQPKVNEVYFTLMCNKIHQVQIIEYDKEDNLYHTVSLKNGQQYGVKEEELFENEQELIESLRK